MAKGASDGCIVRFLTAIDMFTARELPWYGRFWGWEMAGEERTRRTGIGLEANELEGHEIPVYFVSLGKGKGAEAGWPAFWDHTCLKAR